MLVSYLFTLYRGCPLGNTVHPSQPHNSKPGIVGAVSLLVRKRVFCIAHMSHIIPNYFPKLDRNHSAATLISYLQFLWSFVTAARSFLSRLTSIIIHSTYDNGGESKVPSATKGLNVRKYLISYIQRNSLFKKRRKEEKKKRRRKEEKKKRRKEEKKKRRKEEINVYSLEEWLISFFFFPCSTVEFAT